MLGLTNTYKNITKVSLLENDANYILDDIVSDGVYAVDANGKLIDYNTADATALGVALIAGEHKFMIAKSDATNNGSNYNLLWTNNTSDLSLTNYSNADGTNSYGYLPKPDGTFGGSTHLSDDFTTWTNGALSDFNGKDNTEVIAAASSHAKDMCTVLNTFNQTEQTAGRSADWYVPACGQLALMYLNMTEINEALAKIGGTALAAGYYWSSSEYSSDYAWYVHFNDGRVNGNDGKYNGNQVRFVRDISTSKLLKERVIELEQSIPTKVSLLENDKNYIENGDGYNSGVYIAVQSGKLINPDEYDSTTETAVGVAVIDPKANFIIGLNHTVSIPWGTSNQGLYNIDISGLTNYSNETAAATDMDGISNTNAITAIYSNLGCAAGSAKGSELLNFGGDPLDPYLGSAGEWQIVINNYEAVKSAIATAGGNVLQSSSLRYWTSTEYSATSAWLARFSSKGALYSYTKPSTSSEYCVVPFYKIDNELTISTKINFITTPAGSSTAPIYIDSNGNITSTTYGGGTKVTLNGSEKGGSTASFYAPTSAGTSGYILTSNGSDAPSWLSPGKKIASVSGSDVVSLSKTMHTVITDFTSGKLYYVQSTTQLEEYSFEFVCPENFPGIIIYPSTSWINIPETFTAGKTYIGSILGNTGIILECETALDYGDLSSVSWSVSVSLPVISGNVVEQSITIYLGNRIMTQTDTTIEKCVKIYNSFFGDARYYTPSSNKGIIDKFSTTVTLRRTFNGAEVVSFLRPDPSKYTVSLYTIGSSLVTFLLNTPLSLIKTKSGGISYTFYVGTLKYAS